MTSIPSIACLGVIGKNNNPLHISIFPSSPLSKPLRTPLQFSLLLSSTIDIFETRHKANVSSGGGLSGDLGLLSAVDERLATYGFETNTGVRFVVVVDMRGRGVGGGAGGGAGGLGMGGVGGAGMSGGGLREGDLKMVFRAMQAAYVRLLQNPFYDPDEHSPPNGKGGKKITSRKFAEDMRSIGESWIPGSGNL